MSSNPEDTPDRELTAAELERFILHDEDLVGLVLEDGTPLSELPEPDESKPKSKSEIIKKLRGK